MGIVETALFHIEARRADNVTLQDIARFCGVTQFHLARVFQAQTGFTVMAFQRARRLSEAARVLAKGDTEILSAALDAHYGSHEAFSRAFFGHFGVHPSSVRANRTVTNLNLTEPMKMDESLIVELKPHRLEQRASFRVTGMADRFTFETNTGIPALWMNFLDRIDDIPEKTGGPTYGVCFNSDDEGYFDYMVGIESSVRGDVDGFQSVTLPAGKYAIFTHSGHISDFRRTVYTIWNKGIADAGLTYRAAPDFELYDDRFNGATGLGDVEIWIPVE